MKDRRWQIWKGWMAEMWIQFDEKSRVFHLCNGKISYILCILPNAQLGQLYFGKAVRSGDFRYLREPSRRPMSVCISEEDPAFSMEHIRQEYPASGRGDFRDAAVTVRQQNGSGIADLRFVSWQVRAGKPVLPGLPAVYCEEDEEAQTLQILLRDAVTGLEAELLYTMYAELPVVTRSVHFRHTGPETLFLEKAMSMCLDLPATEEPWEWVQFSGAWARERNRIVRSVEPGVISVGSIRGHSSHNHNPFVMLQRRETTETAGEVIGLSLLYSGNFRIQAEMDAWGVTRLTAGIHPQDFRWKLETGGTFQTPEAVMVYADEGTGEMSRVFHRLYRTRLVRGAWRDRVRPILINNWEATALDITEERLLRIARTARDLGVEMFVLDDGWFKGRENFRSGLGDWDRTRDLLPGGVEAVAGKIRDLGLRFGIWIEPEMVNRNSDLYRLHPDWVLQTPGRETGQGRFEYVLDFSRQEIVEYLYTVLENLLEKTQAAYVKWDMNRSMSEVWSAALPADRQGEVFHRYILGVYSLYERLHRRFPEILFESCASGGGRFDAGMLYYAPQGWLSDGTDALERLYTQYGSSYCYPLSSFGAHVSAAPNLQTFRVTPLHTRANVACFGTFGYEMDLCELSPPDQEEVRRQIAFVKKYREVLQFGEFYRLLSPFAGNRVAAWMAVSRDRQTAVVGWYKILNEVNGPFRRVKLQGLDEKADYRINRGEIRGGDALMRIGLLTTDEAAGEWIEGMEPGCDFDSRLYVLEAVSGE